MDVLKLDFIVSKVILIFNLCNSQNPIKLPTFLTIFILLLIDISEILSILISHKRTSRLRY